LVNGGDGAEDAGGGARGSFGVGEVAKLGREGGGKDGGWVEEGAAWLDLDLNSGEGCRGRFEC
jgi:hypothetical protein